MLIYNTLQKPIWTYGFQLWDNTNKSNINKIYNFQNIALFKILNAPSYVSNHTINADLKIPSVYEEAKSYLKRYHLFPILLLEILILLQFLVNSSRRLKRKWCRDLLFDYNKKKK